MDHIKSLGVVAARLLLGYLLGGEAFAQSSTTEQMRVVGTDRRQTFYAARVQLTRLGYLSHGALNFPFSTSIVAGGGDGNGVGEGDTSGVITPDEIEYLSYILVGSSSGSTGGFEAPEEEDTTESVATESVAQGLNTTESVVSSDVVQQKVLYIHNGHTTESVVSDADTTESVVCLLGRLIEADDMDDTGPETSRKSPFALRRAVQVELIKEAWREVFPQDPYPLTLGNAKNFLGWCDNSAQMVYEEIQDIARRKQLDTPVTYVRTVLKNKAAEAKGEGQRPDVRGHAAPARHGSTTSSVGRPLRGAAAYVLGGDLPLPSEEWLEEVRELQAEAEIKKKARGWEE